MLPSTHVFLKSSYFDPFNISPHALNASASAVPVNGVGFGGSGGFGGSVVFGVIAGSDFCVAFSSFFLLQPNAVRPSTSTSAVVSFIIQSSSRARLGP